jgi:hypothetical protein
MKISEMLSSYVRNIHLKAKLKVQITLDNGKVLKKGTVSDFLIDLGDGTYHFESKDSACIVEEAEIQLIKK